MEAVLSRIRRLLEILMMISLLVMVALTFADVLGRHLLNKPIFGAHDVTEHLMAILVFCGLPLVTAAGLHLTVDLLDNYIPALKSRAWRFVIAFIMIAIFLLAGWAYIESGLEATALADNSLELQWPRAPLYFFMGFSFIVSAATAFSWANGKEITYSHGEEGL